jgi:hypothetical protein
LRVLSAFVSILLAPAAVYAQASITGVVKDTSGAVLPGVAVEAASPALIEKVRSVVSDGFGAVSRREPAARRIHGDVYAAWLCHGAAGRDRADGHVHRYRERRPARCALEETLTVTGERRSLTCRAQRGNA